MSIVDNFDTTKHRGWAEGTTQVGYEGNHNIPTWQAGHLPVEWWRGFCTMLRSRAAQGYRLRRLILRGRVCHAAVYVGYNREDRLMRGYLTAIGSQDVLEWVNEVVNEGISCGLSDNEEISG